VSRKGCHTSVTRHAHWTPAQVVSRCGHGEDLIVTLRHQPTSVTCHAGLALGRDPKIEPGARSNFSRGPTHFFLLAP
jgi:hypothetical protein